MHPVCWLHRRDGGCSGGHTEVVEALAGCGIDVNAAMKEDAEEDDASG